MEEIWKDIAGYEGISQISNHGRLKSFRYGERLRTLRVSNAGYYAVALWKNGSATHRSVHRLVAEYFVANPRNKPQINHKDGNKLNNYADNLEWCNASENALHAYSVGLKTSRKGEDVNFAKLNKFQVMRIKLMKSVQPEITQKKIASLFGVARSTIADILCDRTWKHISI